MQQINLYQREFYLSYDYRRITAAGSFIVLLLIFVMVNTYQSYSERQLRSELENKTRALSTLEQSYALLEKEAKPKVKDMRLAAELVRTMRNNNEKRRALDFLRGNDTGNISGFSYLLQGLGRKRDSVRDLWLKKIKLSRGGYNIHLDGSTYSPDLLPKFIQALSEEEIYKDRVFKRLEIKRSADNNRMVDFILDTQDHDKESDEENADDPLTLFISRLKQLSAEDRSPQ